MRDLQESRWVDINGSDEEVPEYYYGFSSLWVWVFGDLRCEGHSTDFKTCKSCNRVKLTQLQEAPIWSAWNISQSYPQSNVICDLKILAINFSTHFYTAKKKKYETAYLMVIRLITSPYKNRNDLARLTVTCPSNFVQVLQHCHVNLVELNLFTSHWYLQLVSVI